MSYIDDDPPRPVLPVIPRRDLPGVPHLDGPCEELAERDADQRRDEEMQDATCDEHRTVLCPMICDRNTNAEERTGELALEVLEQEREALKVLELAQSSSGLPGGARRRYCWPDSYSTGGSEMLWFLIVYLAVIAFAALLGAVLKVAMLALLLGAGGLAVLGALFALVLLPIISAWDHRRARRAGIERPTLMAIARDQRDRHRAERLAGTRR